MLSLPLEHLFINFYSFGICCHLVAVFQEKYVSQQRPPVVNSGHDKYESPNVFTFKRLDFIFHEI